MLESASTSRFLSGYSKIKFYDLILLGIHCNGYGQIFKENLPQNQRFCVETSLFRLTITIITIDDQYRHGKVFKMKRHNDSPEIFTLIQGTATLLTKEDDSFTETTLEKGSAYLAQAGTWHYLAISEDAIVFVAENSGMLPQNTDTLTLDEPYEI